MHGKLHRCKNKKPLWINKEVLKLKKSETYERKLT